MKSVFAAIGMVLLTSATKADPKVYVCDSNTSVAYHNTKSCRGLNRCSHTIVSITVKRRRKKTNVLVKSVIECKRLVSGKQIKVAKIPVMAPGRHFHDMEFGFINLSFRKKH